MKSLGKIFDLLEYVVLRQGEGVTPTEAAEATHLNLVTSTRIMGELVKKGYLEQISRKAGYIPGPMIASLANRDNVYTRLSRAAEHHVKALASELEMPVNLAVLNGNERVMLYFSGPVERRWKPWDHYRFTDHYNTATGRLLLATLPTPEAAKLLAGAPNCALILRELPKIREKGYVDFREHEEAVRVQGHLIEAPGYPVSAIGFGIRPDADPEKTLRRSAETAELIRKELGIHFQAY